MNHVRIARSKKKETNVHIARGHSLQNSPTNLTDKCLCMKLNQNTITDLIFNILLTDGWTHSLKAGVSHVRLEQDPQLRTKYH